MGGLYREVELRTGSIGSGLDCARLHQADWSTDFGGDLPLPSAIDWSAVGALSLNHVLVCLTATSCAPLPFTYSTMWEHARGMDTVSRLPYRITDHST